MKNASSFPVFTPDAQQQQVINLTHGHHLVLAPPGCGKTQILTERIKNALSQGIKVENMLCLTFTNRAARGMLERICAHIESNSLGDLFVGNVHRFCAKFLFENQLVPVGTSVIDDEDAMSILSGYLQEDETAILSNFNRRREYASYIQLAAFMHQIKHQHAKELRLHADCFTPTDVAAFKALCQKYKLDMCGESLVEVYEHTQQYITMVQMDHYEHSVITLILSFLQKMSLAYYYHCYKKEHNLLDFEDLLLLTYDALLQKNNANYKRYNWIQVDEVQDLNPLQLKIIHTLIQPEQCSVLFLGDEQQAIFSFMGAKLSTLEQLKLSCQGNIHRLYTNHRSPSYLLQVFNAYAEHTLKINNSLLPTTLNESEEPQYARVLLSCETIEEQQKAVCKFAKTLLEQNQSETTAIIVNANNDADAISLELNQMAIPHFKVSGEDLFATPIVKLLLAHLGVIDNEFNFIAWSRLLKGLHIFETNATCQKFITTLLQHSIAPTDLLTPQLPTYLERFVNAYETQDIVIFDTETTGLNVLEDDIVQIAAVKIRKGQRVKNGSFGIFIRTNKSIPTMLGNLENPLVNAVKHNTLHAPDEALQQFMNFVGDALLLAHNATYDYEILKNNLSRYLPSMILTHQHSFYFDSLKLIKLIKPGLVSYKLKKLLEHLHLEGENTHLADADVLATISLVNYCYAQSKGKIPAMKAFLERKKVIQKRNALALFYSDIYAKAKEQLHEKKTNIKESVLVKELNSFYNYLLTAELTTILPKVNYIFSFLSTEIIKPEAHFSLASELETHLASINTLKESDLCGSHIVSERIFISTIHKAKGLEFDNVIIYDAVEGRYPNFFSKENEQQVMEDARKFYVALTRAKKRLIIAWSSIRINYYNQPISKQLTRFMTSLLKYFTVK